MRETRRILGDWYITAEEYERGISYPDGICYSFYPIDLHQDGMKEIHQIFLIDGQVPQIPLSALIVRDLDNVYVAGRCASGDRLANSAFRVKASCMAMGQAQELRQRLRCGRMAARRGDAIWNGSRRFCGRMALLYRDGSPQSVPFPSPILHMRFGRIIIL